MGARVIEVPPRTESRVILRRRMIAIRRHDLKRGSTLIPFHFAIDRVGINGLP